MNDDRYILWKERWQLSQQTTRFDVKEKSRKNFSGEQELLWRLLLIPLPWNRQQRSPSFVNQSGSRPFERREQSKEDTTHVLKIQLQVCRHLLLFCILTQSKHAGFFYTQKLSTLLLDISSSSVQHLLLSGFLDYDVTRRLSQRTIHSIHSSAKQTTFPLSSREKRNVSLFQAQIVPHNPAFTFGKN
jgi:hypothetical protein